MRPDIQTIVEKGQQQRAGRDDYLSFRVFQSFTPFLSWLLMKARLSPNAITVIAMGAAVVGGALLALDNRLAYLLAALFFNVFMALDFCDGEVARSLDKQSMSGNYLDHLGHFVMFSALLTGLSVGVYQHNPSSAVLVVGMLGVVGILLGGIAGFLVWKVVCTEYLRTEGRLGNSIESADHVASFEAAGRPGETDCPGEVTVLRRLFRWAILPSNGDCLVYFMIPVVLLNWFVEPLEVGRWTVGVMDAYFVYLCGTNFAVALLIIGKTVLAHRVEAVYAQFWPAPRQRGRVE